MPARLRTLMGPFLLAVGLFSAAPADQAPGADKVTYAIAIHGGAGSSPDNWRDKREAAVRKSLGDVLRMGQQMLAEGSDSLDVVEKVIRHLEDDPRFNAGRGAVFNSQGGHELDASIMDGRDRSCGAVGGVATVKNPISLARLVMSKTPHVLLVADGAEKFADDMGVDRVQPSYFSTEGQRKELERVQKQDRTLKQHHGTVGCVALDKSGALAAGTSTGGLTNKRYGRVGDSPIVGAGTFADNATCGVSCTGRGEDYIRNAIAFQVSALMEYGGKSVDQAVKQLISDQRHPIMGGIIAVSHDGKITMQYNTGGMARAAADSSGRFEVLLGKDD